jgi:putative DNA primase/helicase
VVDQRRPLRVEDGMTTTTVAPPENGATSSTLDATWHEAAFGRIEKWTSSYGSACAMFRTAGARAEVLGGGDLEFNELDRMPTLDREPVTPEMLSGMRERCEIRYDIRFSPQNLEAALLQVAHERPFHPVREYLNALGWDGAARLAMLPDVLGVASTPLNQAMLRKWLIAAVARALRPGCKVDTTLILVGPQGAGKSHFFRALAGSYFCDTPVTIGDKDSLLALGSAWIHEWPELETIQRSRANTVKAFISSCEDVFRAPYDRTPRRYPRGCVIVGTTNDEQFLTDPTGGRRFWVLEVKQQIDVEAVELDRDQLWAEAVHLYNRGERWHLTEVEEKALRTVQRRHEVEDPWEDPLLAYTEAHPEGVTTAGILDMLRVPPAQQTKAHMMRVGAILKRAGFTKKRGTLSTGYRAWMYTNPNRKAGSGAKVVDIEAGRNDLEVSHG